MLKYSFDHNKSFDIENYDKGKPFASFLPGIAGIKGIPMWTFYVNRGQAISSFGVRDKNSPIMEFSPASIAYKNVATSGFRTFIKLKNEGIVYEPFNSIHLDQEIRRIMHIKQNELSIEETNEKLGLKVKVIYFNIPSDDYAGLVRKVEITNLMDRDLGLEVLDGMPEILPYGVETGAYKSIGNLLRSWMDVYNLDNKIPYYKLRASTADEAAVHEITRGHFFLTFSDQEKLLVPIVDFELVFGENTSLIYPNHFAQTPLAEILNSQQVTANKVPCGFTAIEKNMQGYGTLNICSIFGHVADIQCINSRVNQIVDMKYIQRKQEEAKQLCIELTNDIATKTASDLFDAYCRQSYLDNILRGGYPLILDNGKDGFVYHIFSRKHGDLERDYNFFTLEPEYYSQGNGNFRDANQNRRNDIFFNPKTGRFHVKMFMSLIQADGYNPLLVDGCTFEIIPENRQQAGELVDVYIMSHQSDIKKIILDKFTPGKIMNYIANEKVSLRVTDDVFIIEVLKLAKQNIEAGFGEGYWIDHWTYNMDLVENYLKIYPDHLEDFLFKDYTYSFFDSPVYVLPRSEKYVLANNRVRQYGSILEDTKKMKRLSIDINSTNWLRTGNGTGEIYFTNLFVKLLSLSLNKFSTLDPYGMGVEMEANKPGWNDAMNGLPSLFGSGMSETFELKRIVQFILEVVDQVKDRDIYLPVEIYDFLIGVIEILKKYHLEKINDFTYWDEVATARETYRDNIRFGIEGKEIKISLREIQSIYERFLWKLDKGITRAYQLGNDLYPTYFYYEADQFEVFRDEKGKEIISHYGLPKVKVLNFRVYVLPYFLEGPARALKTIKDIREALKLYSKIKETELYDPILKMYKTSVALDKESHEIGRIQAFTPGWLERESVFLHMEYKYLLELLKSGLYDEFFADMQSTLIPFLNPEVYGRSTLENSSFIASSVNPDSSVHGRGFFARLSGSTAEFLSMWIYMMIGKEGFRVQDGTLQMEFAPILPAWFFPEDGKISFKCLGQTEITYYNLRRANTYGTNQAVITHMEFTDSNGKMIVIQGSIIKEGYAKQLREGKIRKIMIYME